MNKDDYAQIPDNAKGEEQSAPNPRSGTVKKTRLRTNEESARPRSRENKDGLGTKV